MRLNGLPQRIVMGGRAIALCSCPIDAAHAGFLTPAERQLLRPDQPAKRQREFCAGRRAAHGAIDAVAPASQRGDVLPKATGPDRGRPVRMPDAGVSLTISHAGNWAVAAASMGGPLGIDIERVPVPDDAVFCGMAFAPDELRHWALPARPAIGRCDIAWAAKEAALKVWGVGLRVPLTGVGLRPLGWNGSAGVPFLLRAERARTDWNGAGALLLACAWRVAGYVIVLAQSASRYDTARAPMQRVAVPAWLVNRHSVNERFDHPTA